MSVDERRSQLVDAAMAIAAREGVEAVTVRAVAAEAGVSLGVVHYCFEDKDELLRAMGRSIALVASDPVRESINVDGDAHTVAHAAAEGMWRGLAARRHMRLLTFEFATAGARSHAMREVAQEHLQQTWSMTASFLNTLAERLETTYTMDMGLLSRLIAGYIDGIEIAWLVDQQDDVAIQSFHALADYVLSLMTPKPGAPQ